MQVKEGKKGRNRQIQEKSQPQKEPAYKEM
jgi:hypothetical protein